MTDQPSQLRIPGRPDPSNNPLILLTEATKAQTDVLVQGFNGVIRWLDGQRQHVYALQPTFDSAGQGFVTYCLGCSESASTLVFPCRVNAEEDMPRPPSAFTTSDPNRPTLPTD